MDGRDGQGVYVSQINAYFKFHIDLVINKGQLYYIVYYIDAFSNFNSVYINRCLKSTKVEKNSVESNLDVLTLKENFLYSDTMKSGIKIV